MFFFAIKRESDEAVYEQIARNLRQLILSERLAAGDRLPAMRKLAKELDVSFGTVRDAYETLALEGFVEITSTGVTVRPQNGEIDSLVFERADRAFSRALQLFRWGGVKQAELLDRVRKEMGGG